MDEKKLLEVCFALAEDLMWEKDTAPLEKLSEDISELDYMTSRLMEIAKKNYYQVEDMPDGHNVLLGAIQYLRVQAIPPLRGNYDWFNHSLSTLLEICNPNILMNNDEIPFLFSLQKGIIKHIELVTKPGNANRE